jgi:hypothetical protein
VAHQLCQSCSLRIDHVSLIYFTENIRFHVISESVADAVHVQCLATLDNDVLCARNEFSWSKLKGTASASTCGRDLIKMIVGMNEKFAVFAAEFSPFQIWRRMLSTDGVERIDLFGVDTGVLRDWLIEDLINHDRSHGVHRDANVF